MIGSGLMCSCGYLRVKLLKTERVALDETAVLAEEDIGNYYMTKHGWVP